MNLRCIAAALGLAASASPLNAAVLVFNGPSDIAGVSDVVSSGTTVFAANLGGIATTVNNVDFSAVNADTGTDTISLAGGSLITTASGDMANNNGVFGSTSAPYTSLPASYQNLLRSASYLSPNSGATWTVSLNSLTIGHTYIVQLWFNDSRATQRTGIVTSVGGNSVTNRYNISNTAGALGQFTTATFTADSATQLFTITGSSIAGAADTQLNAIQLRDLTVPEPTTLALFGAGLLACWAARRKAGSHQHQPIVRTTR